MKEKKKVCTRGILIPGIYLVRPCTRSDDGWGMVSYKVHHQNSKLIEENL